MSVCASAARAESQRRLAELSRYLVKVDEKRGESAGGRTGASDLLANVVRSLDDSVKDGLGGRLGVGGLYHIPTNPIVSSSVGRREGGEGRTHDRLSRLDQPVDLVEDRVERRLEALRVVGDCIASTQACQREKRGREGRGEGRTLLDRLLETVLEGREVRLRGRDALVELVRHGRDALRESSEVGSQVSARTLERFAHRPRA